MVWLLVDIALLGATNPLDESLSKRKKPSSASDAKISEFLVMRIEDAAPRIGAVVTEVDVRALTEPDWKVLYQTWLERHVLIVRGQTLSKSDFLAYSRRFGRLKPHRVKSTRDFESSEIP